MFFSKNKMYPLNLNIPWTHQCSRKSPSCLASHVRTLHSIHDEALRGPLMCTLQGISPPFPMFPPTVFLWRENPSFHIPVPKIIITNWFLAQIRDIGDMGQTHGCHILLLGGLTPENLRKTLYTYLVFYFFCLSLQVLRVERVKNSSWNAIHPSLHDNDHSVYCESYTEEVVVVSAHNSYGRSVCTEHL